jgi:hypothetical protein
MQGAVMVRCPATGAAIATGLQAEPAEFKRQPVFLARCYCPYCRKQHEWFARDAWVQEHATARNAKTGSASAPAPA